MPRGQAPPAASPRLKHTLPNCLPMPAATESNPTLHSSRATAQPPAPLPEYSAGGWGIALRVWRLAHPACCSHCQHPCSWETEGCLVTATAIAHAMTAAQGFKNLLIHLAHHGHCMHPSKPPGDPRTGPPESVTPVPVYTALKTKDRHPQPATASPEARDWPA